MRRTIGQSLYRQFAGVYDYAFGALLQSGREQAIASMRLRPGDHVLEVGVGTGLSLPLYPAGVRVTGIDLSTDMLVRAEARRRERRMDHVSLAVMDAQRMAFADGAFDRVVAMYVASVVPDPARLVAEMRRVCRSKDGLFVLNHFLSSNAALEGVERLLAPLTRRIGFRSDFSLASFVRAAGLDVVDTRPAGRLGYWTLLHARTARR